MHETTLSRLCGAAVLTTALLASGGATPLREQTAVPPSAPGSTPTRIDVSALGPQIGQLVPDFSLRDQSGKAWTRQSILGPKGAMLVFFRSADW